MELMTREKGSLYVNKANEIRNIGDRQFPSFSEEDYFLYSKLILANPKEVLKIIEQERNELEFQLIEDGNDCPESIFVQQALDLLSTKQNELEKVIADAEATISNKSQSNLYNPSGAEFVPVVKRDSVSEDSLESHHDRRDELIDEECNLTVNDIDITSAAFNSKSKNFYYYQAPNAQNVFLHSINSRMLQETYGCMDKSPQAIQGKILQIECCTMNDDLRKRLKYLQHLPVSSVFEVVEIEFDSGLVPHRVIDSFKGELLRDTVSSVFKNTFIDELLHRRKFRQRRERDERKHERAINEINDRQMGKMIKNASASINIGSTLQFPECGSLVDMPALNGSNSDCSASPMSSSPAGPSFAKVE